MDSFEPIDRQAFFNDLGLVFPEDIVSLSDGTNVWPQATTDTTTSISSSSSIAMTVFPCEQHAVRQPSTAAWNADSTLAHASSTLTQVSVPLTVLDEKAFAVMMRSDTQDLVQSLLDRDCNVFEQAFLNHNVLAAPTTMTMSGPDLFNSGNTLDLGPGVDDTNEHGSLYNPSLSFMTVSQNLCAPTAAIAQQALLTPPTTNHLSWMPHPLQQLGSIATSGMSYIDASSFPSASLATIPAPVSAPAPNFNQNAFPLNMTQLQPAPIATHGLLTPPVFNAPQQKATMSTLTASPEYLSDFSSLLQQQQQLHPHPYQPQQLRTTMAPISTSAPKTIHQPHKPSIVAQTTTSTRTNKDKGVSFLVPMNANTFTQSMYPTTATTTTTTNIEHSSAFRDTTMTTEGTAQSQSTTTSVTPKRPLGRPPLQRMPPSSPPTLPESSSWSSSNPTSLRPHSRSHSRSRSRSPSPNRPTSTSTLASASAPPPTKFYFADPYKFSDKKIDNRSFNATKQLKHAQAKEQGLH
ncbi:hypothetical protein BGX33_003293 [Mortierella sp. NVP41]|nr:hypothetical protein BGX33_003293 [Mortierella sp. NVP41]